jgi:hypothetical protein
MSREAQVSKSTAQLVKTCRGDCYRHERKRLAACVVRKTGQEVRGREWIFGRLMLTMDMVLGGFISGIFIASVIILSVLALLGFEGNKGHLCFPQEEKDSPGSEGSRSGLGVRESRLGDGGWQ